MPTVQFADDTKLCRFESNSTIPDDQEERDHRQDWSKNVSEKETWAYRERRRSSVWNNLDAPKTNQQGRRGSILSVWSSGKDKDGRDVLMHDGEAMDGNVLPTKVVELAQSPKNASERRGSALSERRGSILSMWKGGKDENGKDIIGHDDEEWAK